MIKLRGHPEARRPPPGAGAGAEVGLCQLGADSVRHCLRVPRTVVDLALDLSGCEVGDAEVAEMRWPGLARLRLVLSGSRACL